MKLSELRKQASVIVASFKGSSGKAAKATRKVLKGFSSMPATDLQPRLDALEWVRATSEASPKELNLALGVVAALATKADDSLLAYLGRKGVAGYVVHLDPLPLELPAAGTEGHPMDREPTPAMVAKLAESKAAPAPAATVAPTEAQAALAEATEAKANGDSEYAANMAAQTATTERAAASEAATATPASTPATVRDPLVQADTAIMLVDASQGGTVGTLATLHPGGAASFDGTRYTSLRRMQIAVTGKTYALPWSRWATVDAAGEAVELIDQLRSKPNGYTLAALRAKATRGPRGDTAEAKLARHDAKIVKAEANLAKLKEDRLPLLKEWSAEQAAKVQAVAPSPAPAVAG